MSSLQLHLDSIYLCGGQRSQGALDLPVMRPLTNCLRSRENYMYRMLSPRRTRSYIFFYIRIVFYAAMNRQDDFDGDPDFDDDGKDLRADFESTQDVR